MLFDQRESLLSPVTAIHFCSMTIDLPVEDTETLRKASDLDKIVLLGHSFGTLLAMSYYIKYPQQVKGLVLSATMTPYMTKARH